MDAEAAAEAAAAAAAAKREKQDKRRAERDAIEPEPLTPERVSEIASFVEAAGGAVLLGKVATNFEGARKAMIAQHFAILEDSRGQPVVTLDGTLPEDFGSAVGQQPSKKRRKASTGVKAEPTDEAAVKEPPPPLQPDVLENIERHLKEHGGTAAMGKVCTIFEGVKKAQLEQHFVLVPDSRGNPIVTLDGSLPPEELGGGASAQAQEPPGKKRRKVAGAANCEPLTQAVVQDITRLLQANGGVMLLGTLAGKISGLRKAQVQPFFELCQPPNMQGEFMVSLPASRGWQGSAAPIPAWAAQQHTGTPAWAAQQHTGTPAWAAQQHTFTPAWATQQQHTGIPSWAPQQHTGSIIPPARTAQAMAASGGGAGGAAPLDEALLWRIAEYLRQNGGSAPLGKLVSTFERVKKAQLQRHFNMDAIENGEFLVRLPMLTNSNYTVAGGRQWPTNAKVAAQSNGAARNAGPAEPLADELVQRIADYIHEQNGCTTLGRISTIFPGLKKAQLALHFRLTFRMSVSGPDNLVSFLDDAPPPGQSAPPEKWPRKTSAPEELDLGRLEQIAEHLVEAGGSEMMSRLASKFVGLRKAQLAAHFTLEKVEGSNGDFLVTA